MKSSNKRIHLTSEVQSYPQKIQLLIAQKILNKFLNLHQLIKMNKKSQEVYLEEDLLAQGLMDN